nr:hypothetical protein CIT39_06140 [Bradyrhizobium symbiodeficiens]
MVLKIDFDDEHADLLKEVFEFCGLSPENPLDWRFLMTAMAQEIFKAPGRSVEWRQSRYFELLQDIRALQAKDPSLKAASKIAVRLMATKPFNRKYKNLELGYFRKRVAKALNPKFNLFARMKPGQTYENFVGALMDTQFSLPSGLGEDLVEAIAAQMSSELTDRSDLVHHREGIKPNRKV